MKVTYSIVMFAYNEENNILDSVSSVFSATSQALSELVVIANGCSDNTVGVLQDYSNTHVDLPLKIIELDVGDKCNAWNHYIHNVASSDSHVHFFSDADVKFVDGSFDRMTEKLLSSPNANAVAGLPFSGRNRQKYIDMVEKGRCLFGNCYGLKMEFLTLIRKTQFRLPVGLGWIDSAITKVVNRDIEDIDAPRDGKIVFDADSGYFFESLSVFSKADRQLYISRIIRYRLGQMQEKFLEKIGFLNWPETLLSINCKVLEGIDSGTPWYNIKDKYFVKKRIIQQNKKLQPLEENKENLA